MPKIDAQNYSLEDFGKDLKRKRLGSGMSQRYLAEKAKTTQTAIALIEAGKGNPTIDTLERIAGALRCDLRIRLVLPYRNRST